MKLQDMIDRDDRRRLEGAYTTARIVGGDVTLDDFPEVIPHGGKRDCGAPVAFMDYKTLKLYLA